MNKVKLIYNPKSGNEKSSENLDKIISIHQSHGLIIDPFRLQEDANIKDALITIKEEYKYVLIMGGDGTLNSVVNELKKNNIDIPVAVIPAGTANDFANYIGMPEDIEKACLQIINSSVKYMDLGQINDSYFTNLVSTGFFANPYKAAEDDSKAKVGRMAYMFNGITQIKNIQYYNFNIKSKEFSYDGDLYGVIVLNGKTIANVELAPDASAADGYLDVLIIKDKVLESKFQNLITLITEGKFEKLEGIEHFTTSRLYIECKEQPLSDIDGERGPKLPVEIRCIPGALRVLGVNKNF
ncbi:lipid kinase, YegS/Rv2252/BmrU family [Clostridium amylolyticum]|uniref:Lipid kinase, YegS/Rv2252/BmrU family n=1 Tax=Clostridium amylolyticum TaxID=1121298 RepID=A0A1M6NCE8_9CLOT|nr:YegS/Rv2252/BmrU family lipid kinase [Clostridium amylolyticum]SHJ93392.1 lipid kinase, YegS/Rv2252/BmrU family [Clostridium amylolyticum]